MLPHNTSRSPGSVEKVEDMYGDVAGTYRSTAAAYDVDAQVVESDLATLERDGYLVVEGCLSPKLCDDIAAATSSLFWVR